MAVDEDPQLDDTRSIRCCLRHRGNVRPGPKRGQARGHGREANHRLVAAAEVVAHLHGLVVRQQRLHPHHAGVHPPGGERAPHDDLHLRTCHTHTRPTNLFRISPEIDLYPPPVFGCLGFCWFVCLPVAIAGYVAACLRKPSSSRAGCCSSFPVELIERSRGSTYHDAQPVTSPSPHPEKPARAPLFSSILLCVCPEPVLANDCIWTRKWCNKRRLPHRKPPGA